MSLQAFRIHTDDGAHRAGVETLELEALSGGDVLIKVRYSSVNYKDALAGTGTAPILRRSPLVGGIDAAGVVESSGDTALSPGDAVLVTGCGLSEERDGGYADYLRVPAESVIPLPEGLSLEQAMIIGTAGFTAALAIRRLEENHQRPELGPILVSGATGGVGSFAIHLLSKLGYEVAALTGKTASSDYLTALGAARIVDRNAFEFGARPLEAARWGGAIDTAGGATLAGLTRSVRPWGNIASIGLAAGAQLETTVMPFILRGVSILGISSANCPRPWREAVWARLASDLKPDAWDLLHTATVDLAGLPGVFEAMLAGRSRGRTLVRISS